MGTDDHAPPSENPAPAATPGARAIGDILAALAARLPEGGPAERRAATDNPPHDRP